MNKDRSPSWLVNINECPYYIRSANSRSAVSSALAQFQVDHPSNPIDELSIYVHKLSLEEANKVMKWLRKRIPAETTSGIICRDVIRKGNQEQVERPIATKIILLGKDNLEKLRGYKAYLDLWSDMLCITITGLSVESAKTLFSSIEKMKDDEIHGR